MSKRSCGCYESAWNRGTWWKHADEAGRPEFALCEPFGGCSHKCPHR